MRHISSLARPIVVYLMNLARYHGFMCFVYRVIIVCCSYARLAQCDARVWTGEDADESECVRD